MVEVLEGDVRVGQTGFVEGLLGFDEGAQRFGDVPHVGAHGRDNSIMGDPEGDERSGLGIAAEHDPVPARRVAGVLHAQVVLVGEEVGHPVVGDRGTEHVLGGDDALVLCVGPVLDPDPPADPGVPRRSGVTGREDARHSGLEELVDGDPTVEVEPGPCRELHAWFDADTHHDEVGVDGGAVGGLDAGDAVPTDERVDGLAEVEIDAVLGVQVAVDRSDFGTENRGEQS